MKLAFVHEWLTMRGGSEKQIEAAAELYPDAPVHVLVHDPGQYQGPLNNRDIYTSFINRLPLAKTKYRFYLPLFPIAVEQFDMTGFDMVFSSSHAVAKGALTTADQLHVCYCYSPPRYAWDLYQAHLEQGHLKRGLRSALARGVLHYLRQWDVAAANRVDAFVAISHYVARRIAKTYRRTAHVIHPAVDVDRFTPDRQRDDFYLTVSRMVPYKRIDLIVRAFTKLRLPLVVIGDGPQFDQVRAMAGPTVTLMGYQPDAVVDDYLQRCKAFVFAADEDFGIAPVEAQAAGAPVIAYGKGGCLETVIPGKTGLFFPAQSVASLCDAVRCFQSRADQFDPHVQAEHAQQFARCRFKNEVEELIERLWNRFKHGQPVECDAATPVAIHPSVSCPGSQGLR